ncbi:30S ribosomal protein S19 [Helicobacter felis]|uniref:30S ribosomal protein S19 n=1 Tax=Helicobacter felis (strain ATCC 49179 / CCUG 28539 / NCTC 12436 / CS1) TaxID=936155 RepID=E7AAA8_HELFC|nr:30S ribosomal protein S19 [Helicobacter felis ATCC 49179]
MAYTLQKREYLKTHKIDFEQEGHTKMYKVDLWARWNKLYPTRVVKPLALAVGYKVHVLLLASEACI